MTDKARAEFEAWRKANSQKAIRFPATAWAAWQHQQAEIASLQQQLAEASATIERLESLFQDANNKQLDYQVQLGKANDKVAELKKENKNVWKLYRYHQDGEEKLQSDNDRLREALTEIAGNGGICTDEEGCPVCIAEQALQDNREG